MVTAETDIEPLNAVEGVDYELLVGPGGEDYKVSFSATQVNQVVPIRIIDQKKYEKNVKFKVVLSDPEGVRAEMAEYTECVVMITADEETKKLVQTVTQLANMKLKKYQVRENDASSRVYVFFPLLSSTSAPCEHSLIHFWS